MLRIEGLGFRYKAKSILKDVGIELDKGEVLSVVGPNGTGKTTLLKCIAGIIKPGKGTILIDEENLSQMKIQKIAKSVAYVPQSLPSRFPVRVFDAVLMGRRPYITWKPCQKDLELVSGILKSMHLHDIALRNFDRLSGGQKQKVLLARAVAQNTDYLLLDEPTSNLDLKHQMEAMVMVYNMVKKKKVAAVLAMHDLNLSSRFSDRMVMLKAGRVFCSGAPRQVMTVENIKSVYGVDAEIIPTNGHPYILPTVPVNGEEKDEE